MDTTPSKQHEGNSAAARYTHLVSDRDQFLSRGRECANLTIPSVLPPDGFTGSSRLPTPYQSLGARGVRTLASKLLLSLFPSGASYFKWQVDDEVLVKIGSVRGDVEKALASRERATMTEVDTAVFRPAAFQALTHLIVAGNAGMYIPTDPKGRAQVFRLDQYVTRRDAAGNLLEAIIHEKVDINTLPADTRALVVTSKEWTDRGTSNSTPEADVYTWLNLSSPEMWEVKQTVCGVEIPTATGTFKQDALPYLFLRFTALPGEHYGRGYIEEYLGDLDSLEALSEALVEGAAASARILFMVNPGGVTALKVVASSPTGSTVSGNVNDVGVLRVEKGSDLQIAKMQAEEIATRLSYAFLLHSAIQRAGERVTAQEIRYMASELDDGLGGVYTLLAADFQLPTVKLFDARMNKRLKVPKLPTDLVQPILVSGLDAIGRGHDQRNLQAFTQEVIGVLTPQVAMQYLNADEYLKRAAAGYSLDPEGLVKTAEQIAQEQKRQQAMAMIQSLGPDAISAAGGVAAASAKNAGPPAQ